MPAMDVDSAAVVPQEASGDAQTSLHNAEFSFDERSAEFAPDMSEGHLPVLEAFAEQYCLVKVVRNFSWIELVRSLRTSCFRTSTTLLPPGGKGMRLFGQASQQCVGLIWDRRKLDMSGAFIWPSGYFAKSEYNVDEDGNMKNGRRESLVGIEDLMHANATMTYKRAGETITGQVMPFNEVMVHVGGAEGLVGIFARTLSVKHLLLAMGIRALIFRALPAAGELPIFVHDPELGVRPFGRAAQAQLLQEYLVPATPLSGYQDGPHLPVDTQALDLGFAQQLEVHGAIGVTQDALHHVVMSLLEEHGLSVSEQGSGKYAQEVRAILVGGLAAAVAADNAPSALALVREVSPWLCTHASKDEELIITFNEEDTMHRPSSLPTNADLSGYLHALAEQARSPGVLVTVGATILLDEFASGRMMTRVDEACKQLEGWLHESKSLLFRLNSWRELHAHHVPGDGPAMSSFVTHKAIANRLRFHDALLELEGCNDALGCVTKLHGLVGELHHPCLRLEMLQHILGLSERYDLKAVVDVATLAEHILLDLSSHQTGQGSAVITELKPGVLPDKDEFRSHQYEACALRLQGMDFDKNSDDYENAPPHFI